MIAAFFGTVLLAVYLTDRFGGRIPLDKTLPALLFALAALLLLTVAFHAQGSIKHVISLPIPLVVSSIVALRFGFRPAVSTCLCLLLSVLLYERWTLNRRSRR